MHHPLKPPDSPMQNVFNLTDIKGEYIEDCDAIKEETLDSSVSKQIQHQVQLPNFARGSVPPPPYSSNMTAMQSTPSQNLTPLQLIQQLSNYAATNRKRTVIHAQGMYKKKKLENPTNTQSSVKKNEPSNSLQQDTPKQDTACVKTKNSLNKVERLPETCENNNNTTNRKITNVCDAQPEVPDPADINQHPKSMIDCPVCGDIAVAHFHYGGMCCYSCKAFFRRVVNTHKVRVFI